MTAALRAFVRERAGRRCEYCRLHEDDADFLSFHVKHVVAKQHGGTNEPDLLCYARSERNWSKGPNLSGFIGGKIHPLFNPRKQNWKRHFRWERATLIGKTKTGKVKGRVLNINEPSRVMLCEHLLLEGRFQPEG